MAHLRAGEDDLVTGEAVALDLPAATNGTRAASGLIDVVVTIALLVGASVLAVVLALDTDAALLAAAQLVGFVLVLIGLPVASETLTRGRTLGKWAVGLRTVRDDAGPISFRHALVRALVGFVEIWVFSGVPALVSAMVSKRGKRLGDHVAGTYVVRDRFKLALPLPPVMPPHLAPWAASADLARLPTGLTLAVRQFLMRAASFGAQARATQGLRLAEQVGRYVAPPPPYGTPPEDFLAAVLSERRNRDLGRLRTQQDLHDRLDGALRARP